MVGWFAGNRAKIPVLAVSRGWTGENWKVGLYERLDRRMLRRMKKVICVSQAQGKKVAAAAACARTELRSYPTRFAVTVSNNPIHITAKASSTSSRLRHDQESDSSSARQAGSVPRRVSTS